MMAIRLNLPVRFTRQTKFVVKCSDLSHKIFAPNKGIRLTRFRFGQTDKLPTTQVIYFK